MNILVFAKEILDSSVRLEICEAERTVVQKEPEPIWIINPADRAAVEVAVQLREQHGGSVTVVMAGPATAGRTLRLALARGADRGILLCDDGLAGADVLGTALALSAVARQLSYDLILCGNGSLDTSVSAVPAMLAEQLGLPQVTGCVSLGVRPEASGGRSIRAERRLERGSRQIVDSSLPAVVAVESSIVEPRSISMREFAAARRRPVEQLTLADLGLAAEQVGGGAAGISVSWLAAPRPRPKRVWLPDASMSAADRLKFLMSGGIQKKSSSTFIEGPAEQVANHIVDYLRKEKII